LVVGSPLDYWRLAEVFSACLVLCIFLVACGLLHNYKLNYIVKMFGLEVWKVALQHSVGVLT